MVSLPLAPRWTTTVNGTTPDPEGDTAARVGVTVTPVGTGLTSTVPPPWGLTHT
jgi:hypothetical protein